ncbi:hypothetical protein [Flavobacterium sp.]|uniref:hypothetical protein n=1 Tax=Flavobacterium sp. TaxID=239 RepID=UPI002B4B4221|nr:hypothetical protein [Flavobacterium sp.]HLP62915.1 hypothetical protein [Flavobacterium sp.]
MKKIILLLCLALGLISMNTPSKKHRFGLVNEVSVTEKFDIKIKNDLNDEVSVINSGSGGSYRLTKNATTTIKMEEGDQLHYYEKGKKGALILTATKEMHGKVQLLSKI